MSSSYEKQMQWRKAAMIKAERQRQQLELESSPSFRPRLYDPNTVQEFSGRARVLNDESRLRHKHRQEQGRVEKQLREERLEHSARGHTPKTQTAAVVLAAQQAAAAPSAATEAVTPSPQLLSSSATTSMTSPFAAVEITNLDSHLGGSRPGPGSAAVDGIVGRISPPQPTPLHMQQSAVYLRNDATAGGVPQPQYHAEGVGRCAAEAAEIDLASMSTESTADEPLIELLERERRQWQDEREKLVQCIHLQQLELTQRSVAAHERAVDIAKEFSRAIEAFEERLVTVESTVQKEIMSIKSIAEALLHATTRQQQQQQQQQQLSEPTNHQSSSLQAHLIGNNGDNSHQPHQTTGSVGGNAGSKTLR